MVDADNLSGRDTLTIAGVPPCRIESPQSEDEFRELILECGSRGYALVPVGGRTALSQGNPLSNSHWVAAQTRAFSGNVEFSPADMVITCRAGTTLENVKSQLAKENQFLPFDPPYPETATMGGIVGSNAHGLWRPAYGIPRDRLLGLRAIMADGSVVRAGGKVVKNVAGYDLCKLFAGSWGTLGLITEVTFKTSPLPQNKQMLHFTASGPIQLARAALVIHVKNLQPIYAAIVLGETCVLAVGLMGSTEQISYQSELISATLEREGLERSDNTLPEDEIRGHICDSLQPIHARIAIRPTEIPSLVQALIGLEESAPRRMLVQTQSGLVDAAFDVPAGRISLLDAVRRIRSCAPPSSHVVFSRVPEEHREDFGDIWGRPRADFHLHQRIKRTLDPHGLFCPGRFIGGL